MTEIVENKETGVAKLEANVQTLEKDITDFKEVCFWDATTSDKQ